MLKKIIALLFAVSAFLSIPFLSYSIDATVLKEDGKEFYIKNVMLNWSDGFFTEKNDFLLKRRNEGWDKIYFSVVKEIGFNSNEISILMENGEMIKGMKNDFKLNGEFFGFSESRRMIFKIKDINKITFVKSGSENGLKLEGFKGDITTDKREQGKKPEIKETKEEKINIESRDNKNSEEIKKYKRCTINNTHIYYEKSWEFCPVDGGRLE